VKVLLEQERTQVSELMEQISGLQLEIEGIKEDHLNKEEALKRENTVLRDQLKKYVSLVQAQRKETMKQSPLDGACISIIMYHNVRVFVCMMYWVSPNSD